MARDGGLLMTVIRVEFIILTLLSFMFVVIYGFGSPWYRSPVGRHLFAYGFVIFGILALQQWSVYVSQLPLWVWWAALGAFILVVGWRIMLVLHAQRSGKSWIKERDEYERDTE